MNMQHGGWQHISTYDSLETKPRYAVFLFPASHTDDDALPEEIKTVRDFGLRECTHWHPIQDPAAIPAKEIPKTAIKNLSAKQIAALTLLEKHAVDFHAVIKAGANLSTMSALVKMGLATVLTNAGIKEWSITASGMRALQAAENPRSE